MVPTSPPTTDVGRRQGVRRGRRVVGGLAIVVVLSGLFGAGWWAGREALSPPQDPLTQPDTLTYEVVLGSVARELGATATASWPTVAQLTAAAAGVVTSVDISAGEVVVDGARLLTVNLRPVVVARGDVPAFRTLVEGIEGADVVALQTFLTRQGHYSGVADGDFDVATAEGVEQWQDSLGVPETGEVELGDLVFATDLPAPFRPLVARGASVGPGQALGDLLAPAPRFVIPVTDDQSTLVPPDAEVTVYGPDQQWAAAVSSIDTSSPEGPVLVLVGSDGQSVCGDSCLTVPVEDTSTWQSTIVILPRVDGPVVPLAAVTSRPDGSTSVRTPGGEDITVEIVASDGGLAVVSGIEPGAVIDVPYADD